MSAEDNPAESSLLLRLRVAAEADPGALPRLLASFQNLNVIPRRVVAEFGTAEVLHVQIDLFGLPTGRLDAITAKLGQIPSVLNAYWHHL
jgi:hypothetical protein